MALTQVKTSGIADDAVTLAKQAGGTDGQIITYDASGNPSAVGPGTDGQVLTSTGAGSPPAFEAIPAAAVTALNNATANELVTVGSTTTELDAEANLTFDGSTLAVTGNAAIGNDGSYASVDADDLIIGTTSGSVHRGMTILSPTNKNGGIYFADGDNPNGAHRGYFDYNHTTDALTIGTGGIGHVVINSSGSISVPSGQGIDFSANSHAGGMTSELLDVYEEGTWTPVWQGGGTDMGDGITGVVRCNYVRIGRFVHCRFHFALDNTSGNFTAGDGFSLTGLPFTPSSSSTGSSGTWWGSNSWTAGVRATGNVMAYPSNTIYVGCEYASGIARSVGISLGVSYYTDA